MHITFGNIRQVNIDHMRDIINIDASTRDISGHQDRDFAFAELPQGALALALAFIAVKRDSENSIIIEEGLHPIRAKFCPHKDNRAIHVFLGDDLKKRHVFAAFFHHDDLLADPIHRFRFRRGFDQFWFRHERFSQAFHRFRHGR